MWLRHALKLLSVLLIFSACSPSDRQQVDKLNSLSYACHYRSVDSTETYASRAVLLAADYADGLAEALNNQGFASIIRMDYDAAQRQLDSIPLVTDNQIELFISDVQQMRLCQRRSRNKDFYDYRERAITCMKRIDEERSLLSARQQLRLLYAETEFAIVSSTYYYYIGLEQQSSDALMTILPDEVKRDTAQFLNYLYNIGAGGILSEGTSDEIWQQELDCLLRCYQISQRGGYSFFVANSLEGIAEHLIAIPAATTLNERVLTLVNPDRLPDDQLPIVLSSEALQIFRDFGDVYQTAGAYRTLASCCRAVGDHEAALYHLEQALADSAIMQAPDLVASIYEQLSVAHAAIDDKPNSDYYRNLYLDLQEQTRQDRQLEARAGQLDVVVRQLDWILLAVAATILLLLFLLWLFRYLNRQRQTESPLDEQIEERREQLVVSRLHIEEGERRHLEQRAKVSLVNSLLPLIDRMVYTVNRHGDKEYVCELIDQMNADNELLTQWIQLRQGQLSLRIESFPLQPLFDMVARSSKSFLMKGVSLNVEPTEAVVKADRILTLFMINTLADNARKFTHQGSVTISAMQTQDYVEVSVADTGVGMDTDQLAHVFDRKTVTDDESSGTSSSHGYGLLNCKGIIEKYRKMSQLFSVCTLQAESQEGRGSRFFFRLPLGKLLVLLVLLGQSLSVKAQPAADHLARAAVYADSAYFSNINGTFERTLLFADSCRNCLNEYYRLHYPQGTVFLLHEADTSLTPPEIQWLRDSVNTNYNLILDMRNESAVAALALHEWQLYQYNNRIYTQLYKELSADETLADYCRTMQQTKTNRMIAVGLLLLMLLTILLVYYFYYLRPRFYARFKAERLRRDDLELLDDELRQAEQELAALHVSNAVLDNCLSTLKHETMYYPSRIRQLIDKNDMESVSEVVCYYRELYNLLSQQAMSQVERVKLHLRPIAPSAFQLQSSDVCILGDETLIRYLFDILKRLTGQQRLDMTLSPQGDKYVELTVNVPHPLSFTSHLSRIDSLLCRQIVRDHGEATNRRACSIRTEIQNNVTTIIILLPAYGKLQSNHR